MPDRDRSGPFIDSVMEGPTMVNVEKLRFAVSERVSPSLAQHIRLDQLRDIITNDLAVRLEDFVLAEELPPLTVTDAQRFTVPRLASPWQHFKARYRDRWWMWAVRDLGFMRELRYVDEPHTHTVQVNVRNRWTYPRATTVLPGDRFGHVVFKAQTSQFGEVRQW